MRLTKKDIERANKRRKYSDGRGLFLSVRKTSSRRRPSPTASLTRRTPKDIGNASWG